MLKQAGGVVPPATRGRADVLLARVVDARDISRSYRRVVLAGTDLCRFTARGCDQAFRLFLPRAHQAGLVLPDASHERWSTAWRAMPEHCRPLVRTYTVRRFEASVGELEVEFARHPGGAASDWVRHCAPGDPVGVRAEGFRYAPPATGRQLLVGDDTALPAIMSVLEHVGRQLVADVLLEVPSVDDIRALPGLPHSVSVHWLPRVGGGRGAPGVPIGTLATDAVRRLPPPSVPYAYAYVLGECGMVTAVRRQLVQQWSMPPAHVCGVGYWVA